MKKTAKTTTKSGSRIKRMVSGIINVFKRIIHAIPTWLDWDRMKTLSIDLMKEIKSMFVPQHAVLTETFEEAKVRLHLNEETLQLKQNALLRISRLMVLVALALLVYSGYQLLYGSIQAFIVSIVMTLVALTFSFRYHFWYFQIKRRQLGCTFNDWFKYGLLGVKK